jgi:predicted exporter
VVLVAACAVLIVQRATLWDASISSLNPLREADMTLDGRLRAELGAPDARLLVAVRGASRESV